LQNLDSVLSVLEMKLKQDVRNAYSEIQPALDSLHSSFCVAARAWLAPFADPGLCLWKRKVIWQRWVHFGTYLKLIFWGKKNVKKATEGNRSSQQMPMMPTENVPRCG